MHVDIRQGIAYIHGVNRDNWDEAVQTAHSLTRDGKADNVAFLDGSPLPDTAALEAMGTVAEAEIVIIGAGIIGCAIARELRRYDRSVLVLEKNSDIGEGTTKANNGMVHSGYDPKPGSLKATLAVRGNAMYTQWAEELGFHFNRTGSFVCAFNEDDEEGVRQNYENGVKNGVPGIRIISGDEAREIEPYLSDDITMALWTPTAGYVDVSQVALHAMENAMDNGAGLMLDTEALGFRRQGDELTGVITSKGVVACKHVINVAGLYADDIARYADDQFYTIHPRRGVLVIFDRNNPCKPHTFAGMAPGKYTKGGGPEMTPDGTMLWGPSLLEMRDKEDLAVERDGLDFVLEKGYRLLKGAEAQPGIITYFAGNRACTFNEDFTICNSKLLRNFTHVAGMQSPAVASAPAVAEMVCGLVAERLPLAKRDDFNPYLKKPTPFRDLPPAQRDGETIICRCEMVTEREIVAAIHGRIPARTVDAVKRRTRAGMGRCQGGFCGAKVLEIISRELGIPATEVTLKGDGSQILMSDSREAMP